MSSQNAKIAKYMPDNIRFYSYDFINGVGLWPGPNNKLYYLENFLLYGASSNSLGTQSLNTRYPIHNAGINEHIQALS